MISDFELLEEKVRELASLAQALRRENAELRANAAVLVAENGELGRRMLAAHERVTTLLARMPDPDAQADAHVQAQAHQPETQGASSSQQQPA